MFIVIILFIERFHFPKLFSQFNPMPMENDLFCFISRPNSWRICHFYREPFKIIENRHEFKLHKLFSIGTSLYIVFFVQNPKKNGDHVTANILSNIARILTPSWQKMTFWIRIDQMYHIKDRCTTLVYPFYTQTLFSVSES